MSWESDLQKMHDEEEEHFYQFMADLVGSFWLSYDKDTFLVLNHTDETIQYWTILSAREGVAKITFGFLMSQKRISDA